MLVKQRIDVLTYTWLETKNLYLCTDTSKKTNSKADWEGPQYTTQMATKATTQEISYPYKEKKETNTQNSPKIWKDTPPKNTYKWSMHESIFNPEMSVSLCSQHTLILLPSTCWRVLGSLQRIYLKPKNQTKHPLPSTPEHIH